MNKDMNLTFPQNVILEDETVLLRPIEITDVDNLLEISINEPETWKYSLVGADGKENLINYIQLAIRARENQKEFPFIVFDKKSQKYAGSTRFYDINLEYKTLQLGYSGTVQLLEKLDLINIVNFYYCNLLSKHSEWNV
jgi:RimJ/RimL family protein N-acetyltransferase